MYLQVAIVVTKEAYKKKIKVWGSIMMMSIMMIDLAGHCFMMGGDIKREKKEREQQYRDIEPLVHYVGALLGGYVFLQDGEWPLYRYDQSGNISTYRTEKDGAKKMDGDGDTIEGLDIYIDVLRCEHDGRRGWVWVKLWNAYHPHGPAAGYQDLWFIEKEGLQWKVGYIDGDLSGRRWLWDDGVGGDDG